MRSTFRTALAALVATLALGALGAAPALAAGKPFVETTAASSIGETTATLNGVVNPNGAATKYYFEYGTEKGKLTKKTAEASAGSGESNLKEAAALTGLSAETPYYYRIVAKNSSGTADGLEVAFQTTGIPTLPYISPVPTAKAPLAFSATGGFTEFAGTGTNCLKAAISWEFDSAKAVVNARAYFHECNEGTNGELKSVKLKGTIGYINQATKEVGLLLTPETGREWINLSGKALKLYGSVVGILGNVNTKSKTFKLVFTDPAVTQIEDAEGFHGLTTGEFGGGNEFPLVSELAVSTFKEVEIKA